MGPQSDSPATTEQTWKGKVWHLLSAMNSEKNFHWKVRQGSLWNYCKWSNISSDFDRLSNFKQIRNLSNNFFMTY
jgi:hypothetical protein